MHKHFLDFDELFLKIIKIFLSTKRAVQYYDKNNA